jgi:hypothetical protein
MKAEMDKYAEMVENPFIRVAFVFAEPLPVALAITLVSAILLSRKRRKEVGQASGAHVTT